jgi:ADP-heptose:LPS heptosyltransferase
VVRTLCVRLDSIGDVLVTGPAVRAVAARGDSVTFLAGPAGADAARLLPGVDHVIEWHCPWISPNAPATTPEHVDALVGHLTDVGFDQALIFTSYHQSPLPTALVLRLGRVPWLGAISEDYPGSLLDLRHRVPDDLPEPVRALSLCQAPAV